MLGRSSDVSEMKHLGPFLTHLGSEQSLPWSLRSIKHKATRCILARRCNTNLPPLCFAVVQMGSSGSIISPGKDLLDLHGRVAIVTGAKYAKSMVLARTATDGHPLGIAALVSVCTSHFISCGAVPRCTSLQEVKKKRHMRSRGWKRKDWENTRESLSGSQST